MIEFKQVSKRYHQAASYSVDNLNLTVKRGEILVLLGPSGCGKTTTMKMINRLVSPTSGQILLNGQDIQNINAVELRRSIGYVIQRVGLFPHLTVGENLTIVLRLLRQKPEERHHRAIELLKVIKLEPEEFIDRMPAELSGGQAQRIGVARALAADPDTLLMDEPFTALDAVTRHALQDELIALNKKLKKTIVFVTHDIIEAMRIADRIAIMHEGRLIQIDSYDELMNHPANGFVENFLHSVTQRYSEVLQ